MPSKGTPHRGIRIDDALWRDLVACAGMGREEHGDDRMSEQETLEYQSHELIEGLVKDWVKNAADAARTGSGHPAFDEAVNQMQHLYLAEPWLITTKILNALKLSGWIAPEGTIEVDYSK